ncbi:unnamed protein product, partial [Prunus brigantina]
MQIFYDGLTETCQSTVNNAAGGALKKKNAQESYDIFEMLGSNDQHKDTRGKSAGIYEISPNNELALQVAGLQRKLDSVLNMVPKVPQVEVCGICNVQGHSTHMCPAGNDYPAFIHEQAHMMNSYNQRPRNDPFSNTYNPETLPVIIASDLSPLEEDKLIKVLRDHKNAIGWTIADIKGISPTMCMHRILMEDAKPTREPQRRLNPPMKDVVRTEILKLLDVGVIYPISDSKWVSPIQVVPKKSGITVVKNENKELVPTKPITGWRVCIDYRKLNTA